MRPLRKIIKVNTVDLNDQTSEMNQDHLSEQMPMNNSWGLDFDATGTTLMLATLVQCSGLLALTFLWIWN